MADVKRLVLEAVNAGYDTVEKIAKHTSLPEDIVKVAAEKLEKDGLITRSYTLTPKGEALIRGHENFINVSRVLIDLAISIAVILFIGALLFYLGVLG